MEGNEELNFSDLVYDDEEERLTEFLSDELEKGAQLSAIKMLVHEKFECELSSADISFIERECIRLSFYNWHRTLMDHLEEFLKSPNQDTTKILLNLLTSVNRLDDFPKDLRSSYHFRFLMNNAKIIDDATEKKFIRSLKRYVTSSIEKLNTGIRNEWKFIDLIMKYFQESYQNVARVSKELDRSPTKRSMKTLINLILNLNIDDEIFNELKEVAKSLSSYKEYLIEKEILDIVNKCIKPTALKTTQAQGRWVIEVTGTYILLSEIQARIEEAFSHEPRVEEVRFVGVDMFYVDSNLSQNIWHGKNVVVYANQIKIMEEVSWITSGIDSASLHASDTGTDRNGEGVDGKDGNAGESGGNILVMADQILNSSRWKIVSNGGKGSVGQNGGSGRDGSDGKGVEMSTLRDWNSAVKYKKIQGTVTLSYVKNSFSRNWEFEHSDGIKTYLCYDAGYYVFYWYQHHLMLSKGSNGKAGGSGGALGFGGEGGLKGEVEFYPNNIEARVETIDGSPGLNGIPGFDGIRGKDGHDIGYYWSISGGYTYYGEDKSSKYSLQQFPNRDVKRVYNYYYQNSANPYTGIVSNGKVIQKNASNKVRTTKSSTREKQVHAKASRKKKPVASQIKNLYSNLLDEFSKVDATKAKIQLGIESDEVNLRQLQGAAVSESASTLSQYKRNVPVNNKVSSEVYRSRSEEEKTTVNPFPLPSAVNIFRSMAGKKFDIDEFTSNFMRFEFLSDELDTIQKFFIESHQSEAVMNVADKTLFRPTKNEYLNHFALNTALVSAKLESFMLTHLEFIRSCRIYFEAFESELIRHNADLAPSWLASQQSQWLTEEFEKNITPRPFLAKLYHRMKNFQAKEVQFTHILDDSGISLGFGRFAVNRYPSYTFHLFNGFKKIDFLKRVLIEKREIAALKIIGSKVERKMATINYDEMYCNEENYLKMVPFHEDITDHVSLGRIHNYFIANHMEARGRLASFVKEVFKDYNKNWEILNSLKDSEARNVQKAEGKIKKPTSSKENFVKSQKVRAKIEDTKEFRDVNFSDKLFLSPMLIFLSEVDNDDDEVQRFRKELSELSTFGLNVESLSADAFECAKLVDEIDTFGKQLFSMTSKNISKRAMKVKKIQDLFIENILHNGVESRTCRSLLAAIYEINLRIFKLDEDANKKLVENHNVDKKESLRIFIASQSEFLKVDIDEDLMNLNKRRSSLSSAYKIILDGIKVHQDLDNYMKNETYFKHIENSKPKVESFHQPHADDTDKRIPSKAQSQQPELPVYSLELVLDNFYADTLKNIAKYSENPERKHTNELNSKTKPILPRLDGKLIVGCILEVLKTSAKPLKDKLEIVSVSGHEMLEVLEGILLCLQNNGASVGIDELCVILDIMVDSCLNNKTMDPVLIIWTLMTHSQDLWCIHFIMIQIENNLEKPIMNKDVYEALLKKAKSKQVLVLLAQKLLLEPEKLAESKLMLTLESLQFLSHESIKHLSTLDLKSWKYVGNDEYFRDKLNELPNLRKQTINKLMFYLMQMQSVLGNEPVAQLMDVLIQQKCLIDDELLLEMFLNFYTNEWSLSEDVIKSLDCNRSAEWKVILNEKFACKSAERSISDLTNIIRNNPNVSKNLREGLDSAKISAETIYGEKFSHIMKYRKDDIESWRNKYDEETNLEETLAIILRAIQLTTDGRIVLRSTQMLTLVILLKHDHNILAEVSTGEGKSWIAVAYSIAKILNKENVDVITSSKVLAERDATNREFIEIFKMFGVEVGHNCSENESIRKIAYSSCRVIYGDLSNFQRDFLLDTFYNKNMLGGRRLQNVLIDEVDSMLLDKGNNILYLSHAIPNMDELNSIYIFIWEFINQKVASEEDLLYILDEKVIKNAVLSDMFGTLTKEELGGYFKQLSSSKINEIWHKLIDAGIINNSGLFQPMASSAPFRDMLKDISPEFVNHLVFIVKKNAKRSNQIYVPQHLIPFVMFHLDKWIKSALRALMMKIDKEYIVDVDRSGTRPDINPIVIIQDLDTGTDQFNSEWEDCLHQFLQLKHGCKVSEQSLKAVFISNVSYFKLYENVSGMSGTLGTANERDKLNEIHATDYLVIPTFKPKKFTELETELCFSSEEWGESIRRELIKESNTRSVLVIFETIHDLKQIRKLLQDISDENLMIYDRSFNEPDISDLLPGKIILATNIAGRGTDIKLSKSLEDAGGLHVIITYLPNNIRVEQQAYGRAARSGARGSGRMIVNCSNYGDSRHLMELKQQRDEIELERIENVSEYYKNTIEVEEKLFKSFKNAFATFGNTDSKGTSESNDVQQIVKKNFLDCWAFWLDKNSTDSASKKEKYSNVELIQLIQQHQNLKPDDISKWVDTIKQMSPRSLKRYSQASISNNIFTTTEDSSKWTNASVLSPATLVNFSMHLQKNKQYNDQAKIIREACLSDEKNLAANYFKCFAESKTAGSLKNFHANDSVLESLILFEKRKDLEYINVAMLETIQIKTSNSLKQNNAFKEQHGIRNKLYDIFIGSLLGIMGDNVSPDSFIELFNGNSFLSEKVYEDLLKCEVLTSPRVHFKSFMQTTCDQISYSYGISPNTLKSFLEKYNFKYFDSFEAIQKKLQAEIRMPSCENFWELLLQKGILVDEVKLVTVNVEKLKQMDPSLLKVLEKCSQEKVSLNGRVSLYLIAEENEKEVQNKDGTTEKKDLELLESVLRKHVPDDVDYEMLKKRQIISSNSIASMGSFARKDFRFNVFDNMSREDFSLSEIPEPDIDRIIEILVNTKVIHKTDNKYLLNFEYFDVDQIDLDELQVYKPQVMMLLNRFFIYSITLDKLKNNVAENKGKCFIQLPSQTHMKLMSDLIENHFIESSKVNQDKFDDIENMINKLYGVHTLGIDSISKFMSNASILKFEDFAIMSAMFTIVDPRLPLALPFLPLLPLALPQLLNRSKLCLDDNKENLGPENDKIEDTAKLTVCNQVLLYSKKEELTELLKTLVSSLRTKESPEINLKHLNNYTQSIENAAEIGPFIIKGLDHVLSVDEEKWTWKVIFRFTVVVIVGVLQIAIGALITVLSVGAMTHVGEALMSEGVGDLIFAISSIRTGHFTWNDYLQHKWVSLALTIACGGISSLLSKGKVFLGFGYKIAGPTFSKGGVKFAEMSGMALLEEVGMKEIAVETFKQTLKSLTVAARISVVNYAVDKFMEWKVQSTIESITQNINRDIHDKIKSSPLSLTFEQLFRKCGKDEAMKVLKKTLDSTFQSKELQQAYKILDSVESWTQTVGQALNNKSGKKWYSAIPVVVTALKSSLVVIELMSYVDNAITKTNSNIKIKLNSAKRQTNASDDSEEELQKFQEDARRLMEQKMNQETSFIVSEKIIRPLLIMLMNKIAVVAQNKASGFIRKCWRNRRETKIRKKAMTSIAKLQELKQKGDLTQQETMEQKVHTKNITKLMAQTRSPKMMALLTRQDAPMDMVSVQASVTVIENLRQQAGIDEKFQIAINNGDASDVHGSSGGKKYSIDLKENHFGEGVNSDYNCYYDALCKQFPELKVIGREEFRSRIADVIAVDPKIGKVISKGWHQFSSAKGFYGGARRGTSNNEIHEIRLESFGWRPIDDNVTTSLIPRENDTPSRPVPDFTSGINNRPETMNVILTPNNLRTGTESNKRLSRTLRRLGGHMSDHAGHMLAKVLGGSGNDPRNLFPQNANRNSGEFRNSVENMVRETVEKHGRAAYNVTLEYDDSRRVATRPIRVHVRLEYTNIVNGQRYAFNRTIDNPVP